MTVFSPRAATAVGLIAIGLWSLLAVLTTLVGPIPPFQLTAMSIGLGGLAGLAVVGRQPGGLASLRQPPLIWLHGVIGIFGYHALFFTALRLAPAAEANLINYLWPLLIVLFSAFLPGGGLRRHHVTGALLGLTGVLALVVGRGGLGGEAIRAEHLLGYAAALGCAVTWSAYSVSSRLFPTVPTGAVAGFCLATAGLAGVCHLAFETTVWPAGLIPWLAIAAMGLGPVGLAFYVWDIGMKKGDVRVLGAASYATPVLSTAILVLAGQAAMSGALVLASLLIVSGALVASRDVLLRG